MSGTYKLICGGNLQAYRWGETWQRKQWEKVELKAKRIMQSLKREKVKPRVSHYTVLSPVERYCYDAAKGRTVQYGYDYETTIYKVIAW